MPEAPIILAIHDEDILAELSVCQNDTERTDMALRALRVGFLALKHARGIVDVEAVRKASESFAEETSRRIRTALEGEVAKSMEELSKHIGGDSPIAMAFVQTVTEAIERVTEAHEVKLVGAVQPVVAALSRYEGRREEAQRGTYQGLAFQEAVLTFIESEAIRSRDTVKFVGSTAGSIANRKVGDIVYTLGSEHVAGGASVVIEAKDEQRYTVARAQEEIALARKNREAEVGLFIFSRRSAPEGMRSFIRYGSDIFTAWDPEDKSSDPFLLAALELARVTVLRESHHAKAMAYDFATIDRATKDLERILLDLDNVGKEARAIRSSANKLDGFVSSMTVAAQGSFTSLHLQLEALRKAMASAQPHNLGA